MAYTETNTLSKCQLNGPNKGEGGGGVAGVHTFLQYLLHNHIRKYWMFPLWPPAIGRCLAMVADKGEISVKL